LEIKINAFNISPTVALLTPPLRKLSWTNPRKVKIGLLNIKMNDKCVWVSTFKGLSADLEDAGDAHSRAQTEQKLPQTRQQYMSFLTRT